MNFIEELKNNAEFILTEWFNGRVDNLVSENPRLSIVSIYIKRGFKNYIASEIESIKDLIDKYSIFITESGEINIDTLFSDALKMFNLIPETKFQKGVISGTIGNGMIRFVLPDGMIWNALFGDAGAIKITSSDFEHLKEIIKALQ